jgi:hypothetical protein
MKFHPVQTNECALKKISKIFRECMDEKGVLPKNPWKCKRVHEWLAKMGARMKPGSHRFDPDRGTQDCARFLNFIVQCIPSKNRIRGSRGGHFMRIEIPWDLADRILVLGYLP